VCAPAFHSPLCERVPCLVGGVRSHYIALYQVERRARSVIAAHEEAMRVRRLASNIVARASGAIAEWRAGRRRGHKRPREDAPLTIRTARSRPRLADASSVVIAARSATHPRSVDYIEVRRQVMIRRLIRLANGGREHTGITVNAHALHASDTACETPCDQRRMHPRILYHSEVSITILYVSCIFLSPMSYSMSSPRT